jgi:serine/threonine protein kinase
MRCIGCDTEIQNSDDEFCPTCLAALSSPTASGADPGVGLAALTQRGALTPRLQSGTLLADRYRIVRHLGSGGMGIVYQADDLKLRVSVALKFPNLANPNQRDLELFLNEVRLARQITHPNVCRIFDVGEVDGRHFLSMEHVEGEDLASLLRRFGRLPKERAITIALGICRGLEAAHERGILHRDLKPSNLMIDGRGQARIMDFGLANFSRAAGHYGRIAGTPDYMAPEQRHGESTVRTELYALGLILYELFTGRKARGDFTTGDSAIDGAALGMYLDDVDPIVERVIRHCLERDPRLRPSSVSAVSALLVKLTLPPWRPSEGEGIPHRKHWVLQRKLGTGGFGETWLAAHRKTRDRRVFKFCNDTGKLKAFQREITLFRFMRETLGGRDDIAALVDWQLDEPPYFIESEFAASVNLGEWIKDAGGAQAVTLRDRVEIVRRVAVALSAAHSVGILHKDVKPANVLVGRDADEALRVRLCDFGVSVLTDEARLLAAGVTAAGLTDADGAPSPDAGTRLYMAPELIEGKPPTTTADTYALGVMLYQLVIGDLTRALAPGWDRDVGNDLLREDIAAAVDGAPERRLSAAQLAERLQSLPERAAAREADVNARERARLAEVAVRRRRNWATAVLGGLLVLSLGLGLAFEGAESSARQALIDQTLRGNEAMVRLAAAAVSDRLEDAIRRVTEEASDPSLRKLLEQVPAIEGERVRGPLRDQLQRHLDQVHIRQQPRFQSWAVADKDAWVWVRSPYDPVAAGQNYKYREWFNGRVELPRDAKIQATPRTSTGFSLAFASTAVDRPLLIGLASPVFTGGASDSDRRILGVLNAGIHLEALNGWLQIAERRPGDGGCPERFVLLLHRTQLIRHPCPGPGAPPLPVGEFSDQPAVAALLKTPERRTSGFRDPLRSSDPASAPPALAVASTLDRLPDWTLLLEQDVHVALQPMTSLTTDFHGPAHLAFALGIAAFLALAVLVWWGARARLRESRQVAS